MPQSSNKGPSASAIDSLFGFITFSAVSIGFAYMLSGAFTSVVNHLMRYEALDICRAIGGVL